MKRSEMVDNIIQYLGELDVKYPNGYGYEEQAKYLLDHIEKIGMLPPSKSYMLEYNNSEMKRGFEAVLEAHRWEPENEKK